MIPRTVPERSAADFLPFDRKLPSLKAAAAGCKGCDLYRIGTQTVFGEGPRRATILMVGEQPGDKEDLTGKPFVGPAGQLLDRALEEAGIDRAKVYVTLKWNRSGRRRWFAWEPQQPRPCWESRSRQPSAGES